MTTLNDVARLARVSRATVSLVCRDSPLVAEKTRQRVKEAMRECGYIYNRTAANLRSSRTNTVGLIVPEISNPIYADILAGIEASLEPLGKFVLLASTGESLERQDHFLQRMLEIQVDGLILSGATGTGVDAVEACVAAGVPIVQVLRQFDTTSLDYAGTDNLRGVHSATQYLVRLGHRRIAYLGSSVALTVNADREAGYALALRDDGVAPDPQLVATCPPRYNDAARAALSLLRLDSPPTAIVCFNDVIACGATLGIYELGLEPGRHVSVVGFDDIEAAANWRPAMTSMSIRAREIGEHAGALLAERIDGSRTERKMVLSEAKLVERDSCAPPPNGE
ncbi:MAG TPA: LacI family DNA-binding transcriptional regulator [Paraburkholderia sp.]|nr:LacI family DNA-binding transcriptional regulator [Paraburkholderia sp.]